MTPITTQIYLQEEREVLLDCLERNEKENYPFDLTKFLERVEEINIQLNPGGK